MFSLEELCRNKVEADAKNLLISGHPDETSIPEKNKLETVFTLDDDIESQIAAMYGKQKKKLPESIVYFKEMWIFGPTQEKGVFRDVKKIYNSAIQDCIKEIQREYNCDKGGGTQSFVNYLKKVLERNMIEE